MPTQKHQFLPNDCTFQLRYKPNARVLDHRGEWATQLSERFGVPEWGIIENRFDVFNTEKTLWATIAFNMCGFFSVDVMEHTSFARTVGDLLGFVFSLPGFGANVHAVPIGVKLRFCTPFEGSFEQLTTRVRDRHHVGPLTPCPARHRQREAFEACGSRLSWARRGYERLVI